MTGKSLTLMQRAEEIAEKKGITIDVAMNEAHIERHPPREKVSAPASTGFVPPAPAVLVTAKALAELRICGEEQV